MVIKKCNDSMVQQVGAFYDKIVVWLDSTINYPKWKYKEYPTEASVKLKVSEGSQYICEEDGKIIGAFVLNTDPQGNYAKGKWSQNIPLGEYMILHTLAIDYDIQKKGLGTQVVQFCINKAKADGYKALRVDIVPGNIPAQKLYEKNGFKYVGDEDLDRGFDDIPLFSLFELNL